jgi:hypothetical protein
MYADLVAALPHIQAGKLRAIAVGSPQRVTMLPDVKTIAEQGIKGYRRRVVGRPAGAFGNTQGGGRSHCKRGAARSWPRRKCRTSC